MANDSDESSDCGFRINKAYAQNYKKWRQKEELQKLKDRYGSDVDKDSSSDSETEDEDAEALTAQVEKDWLRTLAAVKTKDPRIYEKNNRFYHSETNDSSEDESSKKKKKKKKKKEKPMFLKDYERKLILERKGEAENENEDNLDDQKLSYVEQEERIKESFKSALADPEESSSDSELFRKKKMSKEEKEKQEEDYLEWLKGCQPITDKNVQEELEPLKKYWDDPNIDDGEKFLKDFILNKRYIDKNENDSDNEDLDEGAGFSEEEKELEKEEHFERKYNFRFEEPDTEFIKTYPRTMKDTLRQKDNKRSQKRKEIKLRKEEEKKKIQEEIKQLKNLKKQEILDKIENLKKVAGCPNIGFTDEDLDGDFDPETYDKMMQKHFGSEFYDDENAEDQKPVFPDDDEFNSDEEHWDDWQGAQKDKDFDEPHVDDPDFVMDADYNANQHTKAEKKKKRSKFYEALVKKKPVFDPKDKTFEEYFDEYYKLDYEDIIDGMPCRFKYRKAVPNNFGLSVEEILKCPDRELNSWVSVKKMSQYRPEEEEMKDVKVFHKKAQNPVKKKNILHSLRDKSEQKPQADSEFLENNVGLKKQKESSKNKTAAKSFGNNEVSHKSKNKEVKNINGSHEIKNIEDSKGIDKEKRKVKKKNKINSDEKSDTEESSLTQTERTNENTQDQKVKKRKRKNFKTKSQSDEEENSSESKKLKMDTITETESNDKTVNEKTKSIPDKKKKKKKKKKPKPLELSDTRLKAYGINPKKFKYTKSRFLTA